MIRQQHVLAGALAFAIMFASAAGAQERDPTASYDTRDVLGRLPHDPDELLTEEEAAGRAIVFSGSLAGTYSTNVGASRFDEVDTGYLTPALGLDVAPISVGGWAIGGGALLDADYYSDDYDNRFGEGRIEGFVFANRPLGPGSFTAEVIALGIFSNDFSDHALDLYIGELNYSIGHGPLNLEFGADYQHSDDPGSRRARFTSSLAYTWPALVWGYDVTLEGDVAYSDFTDGPNSDRNDTLVAATVSAERVVAGWTFEWEAAAVNRLSNRESAEFTAIDLVFEVARAF